MRHIVLALAIVLVQLQPAFANETTWKDFYLKHRDNFTVDYKYSTGDLLALGSVSNKLPSGTPVRIRLTSSVNSDDAMVGTQVSFKVVDDVTLSNATVIRGGTPGTAEVTAVDENGILGEAGKIVVSNFEVKSVNGTLIPLKGTISSKGKKKTSLAITLGVVFCWPFLFMKGKDAELGAGMERTVYTSVDYNF